MSIAESVFSQALSLPADQRGELAFLLLESLPEDQRPLELEPEYEAEVLRRLGEIDQGNAKLLTLDEVMARMRRSSSSSASS
jgi:putative addiction module component (TIGR02574 family)